MLRKLVHQSTYARNVITLVTVTPLAQESIAEALGRAID